MEHNTPRLNKYRVYDEMACKVILYTDNLEEAQDVAYNHQCILVDNISDEVIHDYSADW